MAILPERKKQRILIVDDEEDLLEILSFNLRQAGYEADVCSSAEEALRLDLRGYDLFLLDIMMGQMNGFELSRQLRLREETTHVPIIFLSACNTEDNVLQGFETGADDFIRKPFSVREVLMRIGVTLKRYEPTKEEPVHEPREERTILFEGIKIDLSAMRCTVDGKEVLLTRKEMMLIVLLIENMDRIVERDELREKIWEESPYVMDSTINVCIARLRKKFGRYASNIISRVRFGYCFVSRVETMQG